MIEQEIYMRKIADMYYNRFLSQGYATAGHNGPHGHIDTPVRNTSHYLVIYSYLYKRTKDEKYLRICKLFADYLLREQQKSESGAIQCMVSDKFDHLNGLIGQGWVIEALIYYYGIRKDDNVLETARCIFYSQVYDWELHLWHRIELNGEDIDIDPTYNHHVWFAACSYKLANLCNDPEIKRIIIDFLTYGAKRDFRVHKDGILCHHVNVNRPVMKSIQRKKLIKDILSPLRFLNPRKLDPKYMEYAYHIFDFYGFCILKKEFEHLPLFKSLEYKKAEYCAKNIMYIIKQNGIEQYKKNGKSFNPYGFSYNSFAFEYPFVAISCGWFDNKVIKQIYEIQKELMWDEKSEMFSINQPDIETWNARTYEIIRYIENK